MKRILIMGLPGSGKTTLAKALVEKIDATWFNADEVRKQFNDWDFSPEGRLRQAARMRELADNSNTRFVIADFVCPLPEMREVFSADFTVWIDTIPEGRFADTNKMFVSPDYYDIKVPTQDADHWSDIIATHLLNL